MKIAIGNDHAGLSLKPIVREVLESEGHEVTDLGTNSTEPSDYPVYALAVGQAVASGRAERGVLLCGSGAGVSVAANKVKGVRATVAHETYTAHQSVEHDDVNIVCVGARAIGPELAIDIVRAWVRASFDGIDRHRRRLDEVARMEDTFGTQDQQT